LERVKQYNKLMQTIEQRRAERRWEGAFAKKTTQEAEPDTSHLTTHERFALVWQITRDVWAFTEKPLYESRLSRHVGRVLRGTG
jgi:hypothetical protein